LANAFYRGFAFDTTAIFYVNLLFTLFSLLPLFIFFKPDNSLAKLDTVVAQQIDICPTLLDMIGYDKPFRSSGRNLLSKKEEPFTIKHTGNVYYYIKDNLICTFDGKKHLVFIKNPMKCCNIILLIIKRLK